MAVRAVTDLIPIKPEESFDPTCHKHGALSDGRKLLGVLEIGLTRDPRKWIGLSETKQAQTFRKGTLNGRR